MTLINGIGGVLFRAGDPDSVAEWDARHPGIASKWQLWSQTVGIAVATTAEWDGEWGRFARINDPAGKPIELWQPPAAQV